MSRSTPIQKRIYSYDDYRTFLREHLQSLPKNGHGQLRKLAESLSLSPVTLSQIFAGKRDFLPDHGFEIGRFFGLKADETDFLILLIERDRAVRPLYRERINIKIRQIRSAASDLKKTLPPVSTISDPALARFYSDWRFSAIRILSSIPRFQKISVLASFLGIEGAELSGLLEFLIRYDLIRRQGDRLQPGKASTHLPSDSPFVRHRQMSWRLKAYDFMSNTRAQPENLFFTGPCSLSQESYDALRMKLQEVVSEFVKNLESSSPEQMACLNIDFFKLT